MSTTTIPPPLDSAQISAARILGWLGIAVLAVLGVMAYVMAAGRYFTYSEAAYGNYWIFRSWLMMHIAGGTVALFTGPTQFWTGLRRRNLKLHRLLGKIYMGGVALGSASGFYLSVMSSPRASLSFAISLFLLATAWSSSTAMAYVAARNRNIEIHKEWMIRSYVVTYAFVTFRILFDLPVFAALPIQERVGLMGWMCWAPPLLFTELALQWKRTVGWRPTPATTQR
jgi:uncharacterized membrane protein